MRFLIYQNSRQGPRKNNEDRLGYSYSRESLFMVVADGMGGHLHGEIAAQIAMQFLIDAFQREAQPKIADPHRFLLDTMTSAHLAILAFAESQRYLETPRTTCVACIVQDGAAYWGHVGDSRLYLIRDGRVEAVTKDHSRVQLLVDAGRMRPEAMQAHPDRNKIFNCLGQLHPPRVDISRKTMLHHDDTLILCSDGFWGPLPPSLIVDTLLRKDILRAVPELLDAAELRAGVDGDNLSVVAMTWRDAEQGEENGVSTFNLSVGDHETRPANFGGESGSSAAAQLTDEEIERAISEIRKAINKPPR
ncbi:MAG: PP2C family protein-serine/threonine phosphatase [Burkholderiales bacterium]